MTLLLGKLTRSPFVTTPPSVLIGIGAVLLVVTVISLVRPGPLQRRGYHPRVFSAALAIMAIGSLIAGFRRL